MYHDNSHYFNSLTVKIPILLLTIAIIFFINYLIYNLKYFYCFASINAVKGAIINYLEAVIVVIYMKSLYSNYRLKNSCCKYYVNYFKLSRFGL